jgi:crossover junction endodeoxyribonuclease RuvC
VPDRTNNEQTSRPALFASHLILGVDPGIGHTGYGLIEQRHQQLHSLTSGEIKTAPADPFPKRLKTIFDGIEAVMARHQPTVVAIEETFLAKNFQAALKLGQARGVVLLVMEMHGLPIFEYSPTAVKLGIVGYGRASKEQIKQMVGRILNLPQPPTSEHEADALAIAICHAHSSTFQQRVVASTERSR